ncbi:MAG: AAA family ATPase [Polyangiales bacterium]
MKYDFFLAAAPADAEAAEALYDVLDALGVQVFLDARSVDLGQRRDEASVAGQRNARATAVLVTERSEPDFYTREEVARAVLWGLEHPASHRVVPVILDARAPLERWVPAVLRPFVGVDLYAEGTFAQVGQRLREAVAEEAITKLPIATDPLEAVRASQSLLARLRNLSTDAIDALVTRVAPPLRDASKDDPSRLMVDLVGLAMLDPEGAGRLIDTLLAEGEGRAEESGADLTPAPTRFVLAGFRGVEALEIKLDPPEGRGSVVVLLGENGTGKTTILRAFALALAAPAVAAGLLASASASYLRAGHREARCSLTTTRGEYAIGLAEGDGFDQVTATVPTRGERPFVVGYGCRRGSALGGADQIASPASSHDIDNLFEQPRGLVHAESWLMQLEAAADKSDAARKLLADVKAALLKMLPGVASVDVGGDRQVWVSGPAVGRVRWTALSDGYLTTAGWVVDLMARWIERQTTRLKREVPSDFVARMTGFALIDEIDLHLHPKWQSSVIATARAVFPRMHFIATTHNPLTLLSVREGEVLRLVRDASSERVSAVSYHTDPRLLSGTELLRTFFGIDDVYPDEGGRLLRDYQYLATNPFRTEEDERTLAAMRNDLDARGIEHEIEPVPREPPEETP